MGEQCLYTMDENQKKISSVVYTRDALLEKMETEVLLGWHSVSPLPPPEPQVHPHTIWLKQICIALSDMYAMDDYKNATVNTCYECKDK